MWGDEGGLSRAGAGHRLPPTQDRKKAVDFSTAFFLSSAVAGLPARTCSKPDAYAARTNADSDARPIIVVSPVIVSTPLDVAFARGVVVRISNDNATRTAFPPAASIFVTDHADVFDTVVRNNRKAV